MNPQISEQQLILRKHLIESLSGQNAHATFELAVDGFPMDHINTKIKGVPQSAWQLLEHLRIAQWDILDFIRNPSYQEMPWPSGYWPKEEGNKEKWSESVDSFLDDRDELTKLLNNERTDLFAPLPHAPNYTLFREVTIVANHNSYHTGQLLMLRRAVSA